MTKSVLKNFIKKYINDFNKLSQLKGNNLENFTKIINYLKSSKAKKKTIHVFGNGGSASISSHFSLDLTMNTDLKAKNYNEAAMITCFANDFGYENFIFKSLKLYASKNDILFLISSSGKSKNMLQGVKAARELEFDKIITLTGFEKTNPLKKEGDLNLWANSKSYNFVENTHQLWSLLIVDFLKKR